MRQSCEYEDPGYSLPENSAGAPDVDVQGSRDDDADFENSLTIWSGDRDASLADLGYSITQPTPEVYSSVQFHAAQVAREEVATYDAYAEPSIPRPDHRQPYQQGTYPCDSPASEYTGHQMQQWQFAEVSDPNQEFSVPLLSPPAFLIIPEVYSGSAGSTAAMDFDPFAFGGVDSGSQSCPKYTHSLNRIDTSGEGIPTRQADSISLHYSTSAEMGSDMYHA